MAAADGKVCDDVARSRDGGCTHDYDKVALFVTL